MLTDLFAVDSASSPTDGTEWRAGVCVGGGGAALPFGTLEPPGLSGDYSCG